MSMCQYCGEHRSQCRCELDEALERIKALERERVELRAQLELADLTIDAFRARLLASGRSCRARLRALTEGEPDAVVR